jgi:hypothetical protein
VETKARVLNIEGAAGYLVALGFKGATKWTVRTMIHNGEVRSVRLARKDFVSIEDLDGWFARAFSGRRRGSGVLIPVKSAR